MHSCVRIGRRQRDRFVPRIRTGNGKICKGNRTHAGKAGNPLQELLVIAAHVQLVVAARLWIELDLEQAGLVKTEIEGTQPLELRAFCCSNEAGSSREQRQAGARPKRIPVKSPASTASESTVRSGRKSSETVPSVMRSTSKRLPQ